MAVSRTLWHGVPGSAMPAYYDLSTPDLRALVAHVQALGGPEHPDPPLGGEAKTQAEALYQKHCLQCHGPAGQTSSGFATTIAPAPTNFRQVQPSLDYAQKALEGGIPGTAMIAWKTKLNDDERLLLAKYVRSLFAP
jgi:mono/diheme cytochrome c family protein